MNSWTFRSGADIIYWSLLLFIVCISNASSWNIHIKKFFITDLCSRILLLLLLRYSIYGLVDWLKNMKIYIAVLVLEFILCPILNIIYLISNILFLNGWDNPPKELLIGAIASLIIISIEILFKLFIIIFFWKVILKLVKTWTRSRNIKALKDEEISKFISKLMIKVENIKSKDDPWAICLESLTTDKKVVGLPCHETHIFHKKCISCWLKSQAKWPQWRTKL